jgi:hypothetical protein
MKIEELFEYKGNNNYEGCTAFFNHKNGLWQLKGVQKTVEINKNIHLPPYMWIDNTWTKIHKDFYVIQVFIQCGEYTFTENRLFTITTEEQDTIIENQLHNWFSKEANPFVENDILYFYNYNIAIKDYTVKKITPQQYLILKDFI